MAKNSESLRLFGIKSDFKLNFELHLRLVASLIFQNIGLLKCYKKYVDGNVALNFFGNFLKPHFEYSSSIFSSFADSHLELVYMALCQVKFSLHDLNISLEHRPKVSCLSLLHKIFKNVDRPPIYCSNRLINHFG